MRREPRILPQSTFKKGGFEVKIPRPKAVAEDRNGSLVFVVPILRLRRKGGTVNFLVNGNVDVIEVTRQGRPLFHMIRPPPVPPPPPPASPQRLPVGEFDPDKK